MARVIEISDETFERLKDQLKAEECMDINSLADFVGKKIFVRTVTYHLVGEVKKIVGQLVFLKNASWVADSGRFMNAIKEGKLNEVEPVGDWFFNINTMVDGGEWKHPLPTKQV